jgi:hypothetical protein
VSLLKELNDPARAPILGGTAVQFYALPC